MTSKKITSHAVGTIFVEVLSDGEVKIAAMDYRRRGRTTLRFPMGRSLVEGGEGISETCIRECVEEAAEDKGNFRFELLFRRLMFYQVVPDDMNPDTDLHLKCFICAKVTGGELRHSFHVVEQQSTPNEEVLGPLQWYEAGTLIKNMTVFAHAKAALATLLALAGAHTSVAQRYAVILKQMKSMPPPSEEYRDQVVAYAKALQH